MYDKYELNIAYYELDEKQKEILQNAVMLVDYHYSLRELSKNVCKSKSTLSDDFNTELRKISYELYKCVKKVLLENKKKYFK